MTIKAIIAAYVSMMSIWNAAVNHKNSVEHDSNSVVTGYTVHINKAPKLNTNNGKKWRNLKYAIAVPSSEFSKHSSYAAFYVDDLINSSEGTWEIETKRPVIVFDKNDPNRVRKCTLDIAHVPGFAAGDARFKLDCPNPSSDPRYCSSTPGDYVWTDINTGAGACSVYGFEKDTSGC